MMARIVASRAERMNEGTNDGPAAPLAEIRADLTRFKSDIKRALLLQAIFIIGSIVALLKLLP
jgi:hypothetical protein